MITKENQQLQTYELLKCRIKMQFFGHINNFIIEKKTEKIFENIHDYNSSKLQFLQECM